MKTVFDMKMLVIPMFIILIFSIIGGWTGIYILLFLSVIGFITLTIIMNYSYFKADADKKSNTEAEGLR